MLKVKVANGELVVGNIFHGNSSCGFVCCAEEVIRIVDLKLKVDGFGKELVSDKGATNVLCLDINLQQVTSLHNDGVPIDESVS